MTERGPDAIVRALELPGNLDHDLSSGRLEPPLPGSTRISVFGESIAHVDLDLEPGVLTRADLDATFGEGRDVPRVDYDRPFVLVYEVAVAGAPSRCTLFVRFPGRPERGDAAVSGLTLRIDP